MLVNVCKCKWMVVHPGCLRKQMANAGTACRVCGTALLSDCPRVPQRLLSVPCDVWDRGPRVAISLALGAATSSVLGMVMLGLSIVLSHTVTLGLAAWSLGTFLTLNGWLTLTTLLRASGFTMGPLCDGRAVARGTICIATVCGFLLVSFGIQHIQLPEVSWGRSGRG